MFYSEVQKIQVMERLCEICEMGSRDWENKFECGVRSFPCYKVQEAFEDVIEILEE